MSNFLILLPFIVWLPSWSSEDPKQLFNQLSPIPTEYTVISDLNVNNQGGHIQGIQPYSFNGNQYLFFSGSSSTHGYLAVADDKQVRKLHILDHKPFKHAGGFQIQGNWLAVGIEDNEARTTSRIHVYKLGDPLEDLSPPLAIVQRTGLRERATAGAVAIQQIDQRLLLIVGDWDNRDLDFYAADISQKQKTLTFTKTGEVTMANHPKSGWIDTLARSYQNINLLHYDEDLYVVGFASDGDHTNVADVFSVDNPFDHTPRLTKVLTKRLHTDGTTRFVWGGGLSYDVERGLSIYACAEHISLNTAVSIYR